MGIIDWFKGWRSRDGSGGKKSPDILRCRSPLTGEIFYETRDRDAIAELVAALRTESPSDVRGHCMCIGTLVFDLEGAHEMRVTLHHGERLRWGGSDGDLALLDPDAAMDWLSARGMGFVRKQYEAGRRAEEETLAEVRRWRAALPASMVPYFDKSCNPDEDEDAGDWPRLIAAIEAEFPDPVARARALLDLFGSGAGSWASYRIYEAVPERLLLDLPLDALIAAVGDAPDERRCEGAARLFCSSDFHRARRPDLSRLPEELRHRLFAHAEASPDKDKRHRARAALGRR